MIKGGDRHIDKHTDTHINTMTGPVRKLSLNMKISTGMEKFLQ